MVVAVDIADLQGLVIHHDNGSGLHPIHAHFFEGKRGGSAGSVLIEGMGELDFQWLPRFGELLQSPGCVSQEDFLCDI